MHLFWGLKGLVVYNYALCVNDTRSFAVSFDQNESESWNKPRCARLISFKTKEEKRQQKGPCHFQDFSPPFFFYNSRKKRSRASERASERSLVGYFVSSPGGLAERRSRSHLVTPLLISWGAAHAAAQAKNFLIRQVVIIAHTSLFPLVSFRFLIVGSVRTNDDRLQFQKKRRTTSSLLLLLLLPFDCKNHLIAISFFIIAIMKRREGEARRGKSNFLKKGGRGTARLLLRIH